MEQKIRFRQLSTPLKAALILGGIAIVLLATYALENRELILDLIDLAGQHTDILTKLVDNAAAGTF